MGGKIWIAAVGIVRLGIASSYAQEVSASVIGRVVDPAGSAIVGATVTAKDLDRGTEWPTATNEEGIYAFPRVPVGRYQARVEAKQFKITEKRYFELRAEAFNLSNTPIFASPASQTITSSLFGEIRSAQGERNIEPAAKFYF